MKKKFRSHQINEINSLLGYANLPEEEAKNIKKNAIKDWKRSINRVDFIEKLSKEKEEEVGNLKNQIATLNKNKSSNEQELK